MINLSTYTGKKTMKNSKNIILIIYSAVAMIACGGQSDKPEKPALNAKGEQTKIPALVDTTQINQVTAKPSEFGEKFSYLQGLEMGKQMKELGFKPSIDFFALGLQHAIEGKTDYLSKQELAALQQEVMTTSQKKLDNLIAKKKKDFAAQGKKAKAAGEAFLAKNRSAKGVQVTPSGLQYQVLKDGSGKDAAIGDVLLVNIKGQFIDGTVFEDTFGKQPIPMRLDKNIMPAWREALMMMSVGKRLRLFVPSELAFGKDGVFPQIPPYTALIFEIEIVENRGQAKQ